MKLHKKLAVLSLAAATSFGTVFQSLPAVVMAQEIAMSDADEVIDETLGVPVLSTDSIARSWHTIAFSWNAVDGAAGYQVLVDGTETVDIAEGTTSVTKDFYAEGAADPTNTQHTFKIRAKKDNSFSGWSEEVTISTRNSLTPVSAEWTGGLYTDHKIDRAFDHVIQTGDNGFHSNGTDVYNHKVILDFGKVHDLEKVEILPRTDGGNGTVTLLGAEISSDGIHWTDIGYIEVAASAAVRTMEIGQRALSAPASFKSIRKFLLGI